MSFLGTVGSGRRAQKITGEGPSLTDPSSLPEHRTPNTEHRLRQVGKTSERPGARIIGRVLTTLFTIVSLSSLSAQSSGDFTLTGARVLLPDGALAEGLAVVISEGQIRRVTDASEAELPGVKRLPAASVLSPGLIDVGSSIGSYLQNVETARKLDPEASARDAVDALHRSLQLALKSGITAAMVCPSPRNVVSGRAATFSTAAPNGELRVLRDDGPMVFALADLVLRSDRAPTSRGGARHLLRDALAVARAGQGPPPLKSFVEGRIPGLVFCDAEPDVRAALELFDEVGRVAHVFYSPSAKIGSVRAYAAEVAKRNALAIIGPFDFTSDEPGLRAPGVLDQAGVRVAFSGGLPVNRSRLLGLLVRRGRHRP